MNGSVDFQKQNKGVETSKSAINEGLLKRIYGNVSKKVKKVRKNVVSATAPLVVLGSIGASAAVLPNTGCAYEDVAEQNVEGSEKVATVKQALTYNFGTPVKLPAQINHSNRQQMRPSVVDNGSSWGLMYMSDHEDNPFGVDAYGATINKSNLAVTSGPWLIEGANNEEHDLDFKLCAGYAWDITQRSGIFAEVLRYDTVGSPVPTSVINELPVDDINNYFFSIGSLACDHANNKLLLTHDASGYHRPYIYDNNVLTQLSSCNDGNGNMMGIHVYNNQFIYSLDGEIKVVSWDGSECTGSPELIDGPSGVVNVAGLNQYGPYMAPDGSGLFYSQRESGYNNLYYAPIIATPVCGNGTEEGTEQCDNGASNTNTPCSAPYGGSCTYCDTSCNEHKVTGAFCDDDIINGPEQCDDGPVLNGQTCTPTYNQTCSYCTATCTDAVVPKQQWCGDGVKNGPEACDGSQLGGASCVTLGFPGGTLGCDASCSYNTTNCDALPSCGDTVCNNGETCQTCPGDCGDCCGNGAINPGEQCDNGTANTNTPVTVDWQLSCPNEDSYCDTSCNEHTVEGACCGDDTCDNGNEDQNNCVNDCGSGGAGGAAGAGGSAGEGGTGGVAGAAGEGGTGGIGGTGGTGGTETGGTGGTETGGTGGTETGGTGGTGGTETGGTGGTSGSECYLTVVSGTGCEITNCDTARIASTVNGSCTYKYAKNPNDVPSTVTCTGTWNGFVINTDKKTLYEDKAGIDCNIDEGGNGDNKLKIALAQQGGADYGIEAGGVDTNYGFKYKPELNPNGTPEVVTIYSNEGRAWLKINGQQIVTLREGDAPAEISIRRSDLSVIGVEPDIGKVPKESDDDGGCSVCSATPGDVSNNINGYVGLVMLAGVMAYRRSRRSRRREE